MSVHKKFSTSIFQSKLLSPSSSLIKNLKREFPLIEKNDFEGKVWSEKNYPYGFTTYGSLSKLHLFSPYFAELEKKIKKQVDLFIKQMQWDVSTHEIQVSSFWLNRMAKNCIHTSHLHPLSVISGTFYVDLPAGSSRIQFEDPRLPQLMAVPPLKPKGLDARFFSIFPKTGDLVLFESWLKHEVPLQKVDKNRLSISFNYDWKS